MFASKFGQKLLRFTFGVVFLIVLIEVTIFIRLNKNSDANVQIRKLVGEYEASLCNYQLNESAFMDQKLKMECPNTGIVTTFYCGELEHQMWEYASVVAVAKKTNLKPFVPVCVHSLLSLIFSGLTTPYLSRIAHCDIRLPRAVGNTENWGSFNESIVLPFCTRTTDDVLEVIDVVRREFQFRKALKSYAMNLMESLPKPFPEPPVYIGLFVGRSFPDPINDKGIHFPDDEHIVKSFNYMRVKNNNNTVFIVVSDFDDVKKKVYMKSRDAFFIEARSLPLFGMDLAVLSFCNKTILGYDGIGVWAALLSDGETIVFESDDDRYHPFVQTFKTWTYFY